MKTKSQSKKPVKPSQVLKTLKTIGKRMENEISCLNYGGCCVYAANIGEILEKKGFEVRVVTRKTLAHYEGNVFANVKNDPKIKCPVEAEEKLGISFHHVAIAVKLGNRWYTHDSESTYKTMKHFGDRMWPVNPTYLTVNQAKSFAAVKNFWNSTFNRKQIPTVRQIIKEEFSVL